MATSYTVHHGFAHGEVFYTRDNADEIGALPKAVRDAQSVLGHITENPDRDTAATAPADPAGTSGKGK